MLIQDEKLGPLATCQPKSSYFNSCGVVFLTAGTVAAQVPNQHSMVIRGPAIIEGANAKQIALLRVWQVGEYRANFSVGAGPGGIASDGENLWIADNTDKTLSVLNTSTGSVVNTYAVSGVPDSIAFDGKHMWVTDRAGSQVHIVLASTGAVVDSVVVGALPLRIAFDGTNMWVGNEAVTPSVFSGHRIFL
jgi:DNA-binding beta-propeller fold protein YncE